MKISMVMPIYNEERLLPLHLKLASPYIDEIILVDGSPSGPSTDKTRDLIDEGNYDNVRVLEGTFELKDRPGGWDKSAQIRVGVEKAKGNLLIITSCDCIYGDYESLVETINRCPNGKVYYCFAREFFIDTTWVRLIPSPYPLPLVGPVIFRRRLFAPEGNAFYDENLIDQREYVYLQDEKKFHYGWVSSCGKQVAKHVRNVKSGHWGEQGEQLLDRGQDVLDAWAIMHVSNYAQEIVFPYIADGGHPFDSLEFSYMDDFDSVLAEFQEKHGKSYIDCIK